MMFGISIVVLIEFEETMLRLQESGMLFRSDNGKPIDGN